MRNFLLRHSRFFGGLITLLIIVAVTAWDRHALYGFGLGVLLMQIGYRCKHGEWFDYD